jgi:putative Mg2+ transporter-C (MgtC) family protein
MPLHVTWADLVVRLVSTLIAGAVIGYNRGEHGEAAGLRTTLLVCLAAAIAMLQVNYLLPWAGRSSDSFVMNDLMRLPLGILTGVGFIGGGAILHRVREVRQPSDVSIPRVVEDLSRQPGVCAVQWRRLS